MSQALALSIWQTSKNCLENGTWVTLGMSWPARQCWKLAMASPGPSRKMMRRGLRIAAGCTGECAMPVCAMVDEVDGIAGGLRFAIGEIKRGVK